jgi:pimeloyl-ACP methyl ester carboxylesterase
MESIIKQTYKTPRHTTAYLQCGTDDGKLMFFLHGWPELSLVWKSQLEYFAASGWKCIAPDMRGYGDSLVHDTVDAYQISEILLDMIELHDALGGQPAVWVGHDSGCRVVWSMASHYSERCIGIINLCVPYIARGIVASNLIPLVNRDIYPEKEFPAGQWDYFLFYWENFTQAAEDFEANVEATMKLLYRRGSPDVVGKIAPTAGVRSNGGWFGSKRKAPDLPRDESMLSQDDFDELVAAYRKTGFKGPNSSYINEQANLRFAASASNFGRLDLPVLFIHAAYDSVLDTLNSRLAEPMRMDCSNLTEVTINAGHELQIEKPVAVNQAIQGWLHNNNNI